MSRPAARCNPRNVQWMAAEIVARPAARVEAFQAVAEEFQSEGGSVR